MTVNQQDPNIPPNEETCCQSREEPVEEHSRKTLQSRTGVYNRNTCIVCQQGCKLDRVEFLETGSRMLKVVDYFQIRAFSLEWTQFLIQGMLLQICQISPERLGQHAKKIIKNHASKQEIQKIKDVNQVITDLEIIEIVR